MIETVSSLLEHFVLFQTVLSSLLSFCLMAEYVDKCFINIFGQIQLSYFTPVYVEL